MVFRAFPHRFLLAALLLTTLALGTPPVAARASDLAQAGHVLNRIAYGPSPADLAYIQAIGIEAYIAEQLNPETIDESDNVRLLEREDALFEWLIPTEETKIVATGAFWRYRKGTDEPDQAWRETAFDDAAWLQGPTGIGYGDGDDETVLEDMRRVADDEDRPGYTSVYLRHTFQLTDASLATVADLILRVDYDDGFKAYLNETEIARANLPASDAAHDATATASHEAGTARDFDISEHTDLLKTGRNVLAIQVHNRSLTSSDLSMIPELLSRRILPGPARRVMRGISELQQLVHIRGVYSRRQLQAVLAEFWENHLTTDYDKLVDYLDDLQNSDATDAMTRDQARAEAAQLEYQEYQFFYDNALGNFTDLLLYSATSPTMLVYLDNVLNVSGKPNENYAREILELHTLGVDNRYTQTDIEQLARCFTGWNVCKVPAANAPSFPNSALEPPLQCGVLSEDTTFLDLGAGWKYFKGAEEPAPGTGGQATIAWTTVDFDDGDWLDGATGIGYGDGDDTTVLNDMRNSYLSVYLRRAFNVNDPADFENLILEVAYDDGFVAYLNGAEVARSASMEGTGSPPAHDQDADDSHEANEGAELFNLTQFTALLQPGPNVLAIQVHNSSRGSSDLSLLPKLINRTILPGSVENGDHSAVWTFNFRADEHDTKEKVLFSGTPQEIVIPAGREGRDGLLDALEVIQSLADHPSTAEFICIKLIQRFVSDEITLATYKNGTAPTELRDLLDDAIAAWNATEPAGDIATVMQTLLDPVNQSGLFWSESAYRNKAKTPIEYINSSLRALDAQAAGEGLPQRTDAMGMDLFQRDEPDGYSELGTDWIDTASMLERIEFVGELAENRNTEFAWDSLGYLDARELKTPDDIIDFFDEILYQKTLSEANRNLLLEYLMTNEDGAAEPLDRADSAAFQRRVQELVGLMLSLPQWHFQ